MAEKVDAATKKVEDIVGKIADMVTSVELVASYSANPTGDGLTFSLLLKKKMYLVKVLQMPLPSPKVIKFKQEISL